MNEHQTGVFQLFLTLFGMLHALTFQQWLSLVVVLTGLGTFLVNWYYKRATLCIQRDKLNQLGNRTDAN